jgi:hypothetical protein
MNRPILSASEHVSVTWSSSNSQPFASLRLRCVQRGQAGERVAGGPGDRVEH